MRHWVWGLMPVSRHGGWGRRTETQRQTTFKTFKTSQKERRKGKFSLNPLKVSHDIYCLRTSSDSLTWCQCLVACPSHQYHPQSIPPSPATSLQTPSCLSLCPSCCSYLSSESNSLLFPVSCDWDWPQARHWTIQAFMELRGEQPHLRYATQ